MENDRIDPFASFLLITNVFAVNCRKTDCGSKEKDCFSSRLANDFMDTNYPLDVETRETEKTDDKKHLCSLERHRLL